VPDGCVSGGVGGGGGGGGGRVFRPWNRRTAGRSVISFPQGRLSLSIPYFSF